MGAAFTWAKLSTAIKAERSEPGARSMTRPRLWRKSGSSRLKCHLDSDAWVIPGEINAMKNCAGCYKGLATLLCEVDGRFIALLSPFDPRKTVFVVEKPGQVA